MNARDIGCEDLGLAIGELQRDGFRLDVIYPADDPKAAILSRAGESVRLVQADAPALPRGLPRFAPEFLVTRAGASPSRGRAGMFYRDLIPSRLGGRYVASHITIPAGGPVSDWVHYHRIALQMIIVRRGWVRVAYEDEGEPLVMEAGDMVLQPPRIRHRVLESSPGLEVIEISAPALHETFADHEMMLPNGSRPGRLFGGQRFLHHRSADVPWTSFHGAQAQETRMMEATAGLADVRMIRRGEAEAIDFPSHEGELVFGFVFEGKAILRGQKLGPADAFVIPPGESWSLAEASEDLLLLQVATARLDAAADCLL